MRVTQTMDIALRILRSRGPMTASQLGIALWWRDGIAARPENVAATMFCRPAGALLRRMLKDGLVRLDDRGKVRMWYAE